MELANHPDEQNRELIETTMKAWQDKGKEFLKDLGFKIGLEVDKSQEKHIDVYLIGATPKIVHYNNFDNELLDYIDNGTQFYEKRKFSEYYY